MAELQLEPLYPILLLGGLMVKMRADRQPCRVRGRGHRSVRPKEWNIAWLQVCREAEGYHSLVARPVSTQDALNCIVCVGVCRVFGSEDG